MDKEAKKAIEDKRVKQRELEYEIHDIIDQFMGEGEAQWLAVDTLWGCPDSPFGWCVYNRFEDPAHDNCLYCHEPQERK